MLKRSSEVNYHICSLEIIIRKVELNICKLKYNTVMMIIYFVLYITAFK